MVELTPLRIAAALLVGVWLAGSAFAIVSAWRRRDAADDKLEGRRPKRGLLPTPEMTPTVFNMSSLPIWWLDKSLRLAGANDAYARAVGHPTAAGAVRDGAELAPVARALAAEARATDRAVVGEERVSIGGERHILDLIAIPLRSGDVAFLALDETRRHDAQTSAATRARALIDSLDALPTAIALFAPDGRLQHHNACFAELFALERAWLDLHPEFDRVLDAMRAGQRLPEVSDFPAWRAKRKHWLTELTAPITESWSLPGGTLLNVVARPTDSGLMLAVDDETERARLAGDRERVLAVHTTTLEHLREGVAVFGPDGRLRIFNRRFAEIVVASPSELEATPDAERLMERLTQILAEPERAAGLRDLILAATAGREARSGRLASTLGYTVDYAVVPLPDGDALLTVSQVKGPDPEAAEPASAEPA